MRAVHAPYRSRSLSIPQRIDKLITELEKDPDFFLDGKVSEA